MRKEPRPHFVIVPYGSDDYGAALTLRESVLRAPLGLTVTSEELEFERDHVHIVGFLGDELVATCVLVPEGDALKMQRVAVTPSRHGSGIGSLLAAFCEAYAKQGGYTILYCHARETAVSFYLKNGYLPEGGAFLEDGIPHLKMRKRM